MRSPDELTAQQVNAWECQQDIYSAPACYARMTRGAQTARQLLWNACWFKRTWAERRGQLHPLARYQVEPEPVPMTGLTARTADMALCRAVQRADDWLNALRTAHEPRLSRSANDHDRGCSGSGAAALSSLTPGGGAGTGTTAPRHEEDSFGRRLEYLLRSGCDGMGCNLCPEYDFCRYGGDDAR